MYVDTRPRRRAPIITVAATVLAVIAAIMACGAGAADAAIAPAFKVNGYFLNGSRGFSGSSAGPVSLSVAGLQTYEASEGCSVSGSMAGSSTPGTAGTLEGTKVLCQGMHIVGNSTCVVKTQGASKGGEFAFNSLKGSLVWLGSTGSAAGVLLEPSTVGGAWATFVISGCALAETYKFTGTAVMALSPEATEALAIQGSLPSAPIRSYWDSAEPRTKTTIGGLRQGTKEVVMSGSFDAWLNSGERFGVFGHS